MLYDRDGVAGDAGEVPLPIRNPDLPDMASAPEMNGTCHPGNKSRWNWTQVIGVDLLTNAPGFCGVETEVGSVTAEGFCEGDGSAPVENAEGLAGPFVDRHGPCERAFVDPCEDYAQGLAEGSDARSVEL